MQRLPPRGGRRFLHPGGTHLMTVASNPQPAPPGGAAPQLLTRKPWVEIGMARTTWYRARASGEAPDLVLVCGVMYWRKSDLAACVARLEPATPRALRRRRAAAENTTTN